jgi:site-specific DNA recombinase
MRRDLFEDFCREYVRELNRLRMEHRAGLSSAKTELASAEREIRKLVQAIKDGVSALSIKDELLSLEARKAELQSRLDAPEMPELLHARMADVYRQKVGSLCAALESEESRTGAVDAIRALIEAIVLEPDGDQLKITLKGDLAGMLSASRDSKRSPDTGDLMVQIKLVAGARSLLFRHGSGALNDDHMAEDICPRCRGVDGLGMLECAQSHARRVAGADRARAGRARPTVPTGRIVRVER